MNTTGCLWRENKRIPLVLFHEVNIFRFPLNLHSPCLGNSVMVSSDNSFILSIITSEASQVASVIHEA